MWVLTRHQSQPPVPLRDADADQRDADADQRGFRRGFSGSSAQGFISFKAAPMQKKEK